MMNAYRTPIDSSEWQRTHTSSFCSLKLIVGATLIPFNALESDGGLKKGSVAGCVLYNERCHHHVYVN